MSTCDSDSDPQFLPYRVSPVLQRRTSARISSTPRISYSVKIPYNFANSDDSDEENLYYTRNYAKLQNQKNKFTDKSTPSKLSERVLRNNQPTGQNKKIKTDITPPTSPQKNYGVTSPRKTKKLTASCTPTKLRIKSVPANSPRTKLSEAFEKVTIGSERRTSILKRSSNKIQTPKKTVTYLNLDDDKSPAKNAKANVRNLKSCNLTPSMQSRSKIINKKNDSLSTACSQLHVSYVPDNLPCREKEYSDIYNFLEGKLNDEIGGCMYISGVPGTGKTATVTEVIRNLKVSSSEGNCPTFTFVSINGMKLSEPKQAYVEIVKQLDGKSVRWEQAQTILENKFTKGSKKSKPVILLVDELDILCTKRQDVVYNLLDWPTKSHAQLIVITIANTMDLPERLLISRVTSRLGLTRLTFQPYSFKQLQEIIAKRLLGTNIFNTDAIQLVSRKVASVSGDARRALDICRRAAEIAQQEGPDTLVDMKHVTAALNAMITQPKIQAIAHCSNVEKILLQSVVAEVERTGVDETKFDSVYKMLQTLSAIEGFHNISVTVALTAVSRLGSSRLLLVDNKSNNIYKKIILNISSDDVYYALSKTAV